LLSVPQRLEGIGERLRVVLASRIAERIERPEARRAAVAALVSAGPEPAILFIKRRVRVGDPWSGQMALPGGFSSPADASLEMTARRETEEETGIALADAGVLLGALDDVSPRTPYLPPLVVTPYVYWVPGEVAAQAGSEVEAVVWLKVRDLFDPGLRKPFRLSLPLEVREFESIIVGDYMIWGLTERVLQQLKEVWGG
jgi:8-oxo-dGTP pyrophosphatase MutT (NUDIX family)